ncbi:MAG: hypothetical protein R2736_13405 [Solirubrobacterales bacterium]
MLAIFFKSLVVVVVKPALCLRSSRTEVANPIPCAIPQTSILPVGYRDGAVRSQSPAAAVRRRDDHFA